MPQPQPVPGPGPGPGPSESASVAAAEVGRRPPSTPPRSPGPIGRRLRRDGRLAQVYDGEVLPAWTGRFGEMLLQRTPKLGQRGTVLDVLCGTGSVTAALSRRPGREGLRVVAIDWAPSLLDVARRKVGDAAGRRVFFRSEMDEGRLPFDSDVYDLVVSNLGLLEVPEPRRLLGEMARVAKPGASVLCTLPMRGSFAEVEALLEEVLREAQLGEALGRLREHRAWLPSAAEARSWLIEAGLVDVRVDCEPYSLLFGGGQEILGAAVVEYGPLPLWREVVGGPGKAPGRDEAVDAVMDRLRQRIDERTWQGPASVSPVSFIPFEVTVRAGCLLGRKPLAPPSSPSGPSGPPGPPGGEEVELHTGEIDIMTLGRMSQK